MEITTAEINARVTLVKLSGTLDITAAEQMDLQFSVLANSRRSLLVDLTQVPFLASLGIRSLLVAARVINRRGDRMVLLNPSPIVEKVLVSTGVDEFMPIRHGQQDALAYLSSL